MYVAPGGLALGVMPFLWLEGIYTGAIYREDGTVRESGEETRYARGAESCIEMKFLFITARACLRCVLRWCVCYVDTSAWI